MKELLEIFYKIIPMSEQQLLDHIERSILPIYGEQVTITNDYIIAKGSPTCLVAHCDTVGKTGVIPMRTPDEKIVNAKGGVLGADDRAGVALILYSISKAKALGYELPSAIFTTQEERGGIGVKILTKEVTKESFDHVNIFIELDRRGVDDYVDYSDGNPEEVDKYFESFGYKPSWGSYSDVDTLTEAYGIPHGNLSCGYHGEHTTKEYLSIPEYAITLSRVLKILQSPIEKRYEVTPRPSYYGYGYRYGSYSWEDDYTDYQNTTDQYGWETIDNSDVSILTSEYAGCISAEEDFGEEYDTKIGCYYKLIRLSDVMGSRYIREYTHVEGHKYRVEDIGNESEEDVSDELIWNLL